jgi:hypothetical protein
MTLREDTTMITAGTCRDIGVIQNIGDAAKKLSLTAAQFQATKRKNRGRREFTNPASTSILTSSNF